MAVVSQHAIATIYCKWLQTGDWNMVGMSLKLSFIFAYLQSVLDPLSDLQQVCTYKEPICKLLSRQKCISKW